MAFQIICLAISRTRTEPRKIGPIVEWAAFKELPYVLFSFGVFFSFWGIYPAYYYIGAFATEVLGISEANSINLLIIMNGTGSIGRLVPAYFADRYTGPLNIMIPFVVCSALTLYGWAGVKNESGLWAFATFYGLFSSAVNGLFPTALSSLTTDLTKMGVRMGMVFTILSFAVLTGTPIAGALISRKNGDYLDMKMFAGTLMMTGGLALVGSRILRTGLVFKTRI